MRRRAYVMLGMFLFLAVGLLTALTSNSMSVAGYVLIGVAVAGLIVYNLIVYIPPLWVKRVSATGKEATATVLANDYLKGVGGYQGGDLWLSLPVKVQPVSETAFETQMACKLSQSMVVQAGTQVQVRYDPNNKKKVILIGSPNEILAGRVKK